MTVVAVTGQPAPGSGGLVYRDLYSPVINAAGQVGFIAQVGQGSVDQINLYRGRSGSETQLLLRQDTDVPPSIAPGMIWQGLKEPGIDANGSLIFVGHVGVGSGTLGHGVYGANDTGVSVFADTLTHLPPLPSGVRAEYARQLAVAGTGQCAIRAQIWGGPYNSTNDSAIFVSTPAGTSTMALTRAPLASQSPTFVPETLGGLVMNGGGQIAFHARSASVLSIGGVPLADDGVWTTGSSGLIKVLRAGDRTPDMAAGSYFVGVGRDNLAFNDAGWIGIYGGLRGGPGQPDASGLWVGTPGQMRLLTRSDQVAPGIGGGAQMGEFYNLELSGRSQVLFNSVLYSDFAHDGELALWLADPGAAPRLLALQGAPAPAIFGPGHTYGGTLQAQTNSKGDVVVLAGIVGLPGNSLAIMSLSADGEFSKVVATGDSIQLAPGDSRIISHLALTDWSGGEDGRRSCLSNSGGLAFMATFTNGTTAILTTTIPNPGTALVIGMTGLAGRRRRTGGGAPRS